MPQRRMISLQIVDTDAFLEMPLSTQALYFHLVMRADDEGFVGNPNKIARAIGSNPDELKVLNAKRFILSFESGIVVIKHWLIHNTIRMDRFHTSTYIKEKASLILTENQAYSESEDPWQPNGNQMATEVKLSKVKLSEVKLIERDEISAIASPSKIANEFFTNIDNQEKALNYFKDKGVEENIVRVEIAKFISYWTELNKSGTRKRWEMEKTFEVERRLKTWFNNTNNYNKINTPASKYVSI